MTRWPLLRTKLHQPQLPDDFVRRSHLWSRLSSGLARQITLLSAPAGFGKSSLVASWLRHLSADGADPDRRAAWLSIDASDNELLTFWPYLTAAIESAFPESCPATRELLSLPAPFASTRYADVLADECADLPGRLILALDDVHLLTDAATLEVLGRWLQHLPPCLHVVLIARSDPSIGLPQLRARKGMNEIHTQDLRFSAAEAAAFLEAALGRPMPPRFDEVIHAATEGWPAGLRLAAISLRDHADLASAAREFDQNSNRYIIDYLVGQALVTQPPDVQEFLLSTALLPRLNAQLCAAVTQHTDASTCQRILEHLERRNVFLISLDDHRGWYRYHHQFQVMLQQQLRTARDGACIEQAQRRAAAWFAAHGFPEDAFGILIRLGDHDSAAALVAALVPDLELTEDWRRLLRMLDGFPPEALRRHPALLIACAWARRFSSAEADVPALLSAAEAALSDSNQSERWPATERSTWRAEIDALRGTLAADNSGIDRQILCERALACLPEAWTWVKVITTTYLALGLTAMHKTDEALRLLNDAVANTPPASRLRVRLHYAIGAISFYTGQTDDLIAQSSQLHAVATEHKVETMASFAEYGMGEGHYLRNELELARMHYERVLERGLGIALAVVVPSAHRLMTLAHIAGDRERMAQVLEQLRTIVHETHNEWSSSALAALEAYGHLLSGDLGAAAIWAAGAHEQFRRPSIINEDVMFIVAEILLAQGSRTSITRARQIVTDLLDYGTRNNVVRLQIRALTLLAQAHSASRAHESALCAIEQAAVLAEPRGYVRWFVESKTTLALLKRLVHLGRHSRQAGRLLDLCTGVHAAWAPRDQRPAHASSGISQREHDVLLLMAEQLTNKEIGLRLGISPLTVRNHALNLFAKFGVSTRKEAVAHARAIGLLPVAEAV